MRVKVCSTRKAVVRHSWVKVAPGVHRCPICGVEKRGEWRDGKKLNVVYLPSGERFSDTGKTPECKDLREFYE